MKTHILALIFLSSIAFSSVLSGCQSLSLNRTQKASSSQEPGVVADEVSLKADRSELEALRKDIPADVQKENDELALILGLMANVDQEPGQIRNKFSQLLRTKREKHNRVMKQKREQFSKQEAEDRNRFLTRLKNDRGAYLSGRGKKAGGSERQAFFNEQDQLRRSFFASERDKRQEFESTLTDERKAFEDYVRERQNHFNQEATEYTTRFYEAKKQKALQKRTEAAAKKTADKQRASEPDPYLEQFKNIPNTPATPLGATDQ